MIREMGEMREGREESRVQGLEIRKEIEGLKEDMRKREERWVMEREEKNRYIGEETGRGGREKQRIGR